MALLFFTSSPFFCHIHSSAAAAVSLAASTKRERKEVAARQLKERVL
jgi:hypothetical protein